ncbi:hypothetical protein P3L10_019008 [Capsicum annuum]|uniref:uncharacterized protein LOC107874979 n=1 Tax=Capsicum annuum TaxID=4072 RepID=UPI0007BFCC7A|nr:uncharacterized protein LOC107874979 [Capsicum annuum]
MHCLMASTRKDQMLAVCTVQDERSLPASFASFLGLCGKVLMGVFFGNLMFLGVILFGTRRFLNAKIGDSRQNFQPSSSAAKQGSIAGPKGKKHKSVNRMCLRTLEACIPISLLF